MVLAYKFLDREGRSLFTGFAWPQPSARVPGDWVDAGAVRPSYQGVHACRAKHLAYWLMDEVWAIELGDPVTDATHKVVAERGRLRYRFRSWSEGLARAHIERSVWRARSHAVVALETVGAPDLGALLTSCTTFAELADRGTALGQRLDPDSHTARLLALAADAGRAAIRGVVAGAPFVAACAAGSAAEVLGSRGDYGPAFHAERSEQSSWIAAQLDAEWSAGG